MHTNRRSFLKLLGTSTTLGCVRKPGRADSGVANSSDTGVNSSDEEVLLLDTGEELDDEADSGFIEEPDETVELADPGYGLPDRVPASVCTSTREDEDLRLSVISGTMPPDIHGHMWVVHPLPPENDSPLFTGDGRVIRLDLSMDGIDAHMRLVRTPCYYADLASNGRSHGFDTMGMARFSFTLGVRNMANTAFVVLDDERVLITYDGGRPHELDPQSMELATAVGRRDEWTGAMPSWMGWILPQPFKMVMSTAHPAVDGNTLFTVEYNTEIIGNGTWTRICRWHGTGPMQSWRLVDIYGTDVSIEQSVHQMVVTEDFIVLVDTAFVTEIEDMFGFDSTIAQSPDTVMWLIRRDDLRDGLDQITAKKVQVPLEVTHAYCDHANPDGIITLHVAHTPAADASEFIEPGDQTISAGMVRNDLIGLVSAATDVGGLGRIQIDGVSGSLLDHTVVRDPLMWGGPALCTHPPLDDSGKMHTMYWASLGLAQELRLQRIEDLYADHPYRHVPVNEIPNENVPPSLIRVDPSGPTIIDSWSFPPGRLCLSPQWVPGGTEGYLVCSMVSDDTETPGSSGCEIWIFDASNLAQGPLTRLGNPDYNVPFTLHTAWTPQATERTASYTVSVRAELTEVVSGMSTTIQTMFENSVYPHFE
jgi:carotenoid cleavage dioxygenase-like enzyme